MSLSPDTSPEMSPEISEDEGELHEPAVPHEPVAAASQLAIQLAPQPPQQQQQQQQPQSKVNKSLELQKSRPAVVPKGEYEAQVRAEAEAKAEADANADGLKEQELLGGLQTDEIWWHPKGLVKEDPTKPQKLIGLNQQLLNNVEACLNKKDLRYKERMVQVMAAIEKINEQEVDPDVASVVDTQNWTDEEMREEISRLRMLNALLNNNLAAWQLRGEHAEKDANNMAERLNNLLFHASRAREMAIDGVPSVPKEERTIHGRAWKFSRGSYPVIGEPDDADDLHARASTLKAGGVPQRNLKLGGVGVLWM